MSKRIVTRAKDAGEALGRLTLLRSVLTIPGIAMALVLSRTLNVCASVLFAYATFLVANPTVGLLAHGIPRRGQDQAVPPQLVLAQDRAIADGDHDVRD